MIKQLIKKMERLRNYGCGYGNEFGEFVRSVIADPEQPLENRVAAWMEYQSFDYDKKHDPDVEKRIPNDEDVQKDLVDFIKLILSEKK